MPGNVRRAVVPVLLTLVIAPCARAGMEKPLLIVQGLHLVYGNAIIGLVQGLLIAELFKTSKLRAVAGMMVANYTWTFAGEFLFQRWVRARLTDASGQAAPLLLTVHNVIGYHITVIALLAVFAAFVAWPFCYLILRRQPRSLLRSVKSCLLAQFVSYAMLCACYVPLSSMSVVTQTSLADPASFAQARDAWIYYISATDGTVWRIHPDGSERTQVADERIESRHASLFFATSADNSTSDLLAHSPVWQDMPERLVRSSLAVDPAVPDESNDQGGDAVFTMSRSPTQLDQSPRPTWQINADLGWPFFAENLQTGQRLRLAMATPLLLWFSSTPVVLPGDQVVYQLDDQIVLLDLNQRKLGLITLGRGLAVARDKAPPPASAPATPESRP